jgi:hypothetical protein
VKVLGLDIQRLRARETSVADPDDYLYRIVGHPTEKDAPITTYQELHQQAYDAYIGNPLAFRIIETLTSYLWGPGPLIQSTSEPAQATIDNWLQLNRFPHRGQQLTRELHLYGELFLLRRPDGYLTPIDPVSVDEVKVSDHDPGIVTACKVIPRDRLATGQGDWYTVPEQVYHLAINRVSNAARGRSTLWVLLPWLRRYKSWLEDRVLLNRGRSSWLWTVAVKNATPTKLREKAQLYAVPPDPGSVLFHADDEAWEAKGLQLNAEDARWDGAALKLMIAAGAGIPIHWLSEVISGTRAVAAEMGGPTQRAFTMLQGDVTTLLTDLLRDHLTLRHQKATDVQIAFPDLTPSDNLQLSQAISTMVPALVTAVDRGWLTDDDARTWLFQIAAKPAAPARAPEPEAPTPDVNDAEDDR